MEKNAKFYDELLKNEYSDLYALKQKKVKKMVKNIVVYEIFFLLIAYGAYDYIVRNLAMFGDYSVVWKGIILGVILFALPPLCFKTTYELFGKTWAGKITNVKYEMRYYQATGSANMRAAGSLGLSKPGKIGGGQEFMKMKLLTDNGKKKTLAYRSHIESVLKEGDRVVKFRGFAYPAEEVEREERYICIVCGKVVRKNICNCPQCEHSIVDLYKAQQPKNVWAEFDNAEF